MVPMGNWGPLQWGFSPVDGVIIKHSSVLVALVAHFAQSPELLEGGRDHSRMHVRAASRSRLAWQNAKSEFHDPPLPKIARSQNTSLYLRAPPL